MVLAAHKYSGKLLKAEKSLIITGESNIMPTELKVYKHERLVDDAFLRPEVRQAFKLLSYDST